MRIAIIGGSGKMGLWFARHLLAEGNDIIITGRNRQKLADVRRQLGVEVSDDPASAVDRADAVIISVPIDSFEDVVKQLQHHLKPEQIVLDITSVKAAPVNTMHRYLKNSRVLGTHPVFGPGAKDIRNQNFVLTPTNENETILAGKIKKYLEERDARVTLMPPEEHDKMMAVILGLAHFIAIVSADTLLGFENIRLMETIGGSTFKALLTLVESVISEDPVFYASLQRHLPGMAEIETAFQKNAETWTNIVRNKDWTEFARKMSALKEKVGKDETELKKAYENMYKLIGGQE